MASSKTKSKAKAPEIVQHREVVSLGLINEWLEIETAKGCWVAFETSDGCFVAHKKEQPWAQFRTWSNGCRESDHRNILGHIEAWERMYGRRG